MIKQLRRKFIAIAMCSIVLVLGSIVAIINLMSYNNVVSNADALLAVLQENDGIFPRYEIKPDGEKRQPHGLSPETPFETRYFTVLLRGDGDVVATDTGRIAAVSTAVAQEYAIELYETGKKTGFLESYKYKTVETKNGTMYIFLDCSKALSSFYNFLLASVLVSIGGILVVLGLVLVLSKVVVKPFAESYAKQKRFITDASHEIKTPLTIIDASAEVLEMENGESGWITSIQNQVKRLTVLTQRLVFLSRMDEENLVLQKSEFLLSNVVGEAVQSFEAIASANNKKLIVTIQPDIKYTGEETHIYQLVSILLDNAMKYSDENGWITLQLKQTGKGKELLVENSVLKVPQGNLNMLFERFYRLDSSRSSETGGYGIGLSAAKAIVSAHKGKISAYSKDGTSIQFKIML